MQKWLKDKEFSPIVCDKLKGWSGHALMSMTREQTEKICGAQEGRRLYSQISIQKSVSGVSILSCCFIWFNVVAFRSTILFALLSYE